MKSKNIFSILLILILLPACGEVTQTPPSAADVTSTPGIELTPIDLQVGYGIKGPWFEMYFTDPTNPAASQGTGGPDSRLVKAIDAARMRIDVAAYSLSLNDVRYALINAHRRGVQVRIVMESTNMDRSDPQALIDGGIPIHGDHLPGLMHNQFIVIDQSEVWTGSMNFTDSGTYEDNNNMIRFESTKLAEDYEIEFKEMFTDDKFGPKVVNNTPNPSFTLDGTRLDVYFSPEDGVLHTLVSLLSSAKNSIYFLAYSLTSHEMGAIVREKAKAGLTVAGVMDEDQVASNQGTEYDSFKQAGLEVRKDGNAGLMHHRVFVIDGKIVALGSYNFSQGAEQNNDENFIIIHNEAIAQEFIKEFKRVWAQAQPDQP